MFRHLAQASQPLSRSVRGLRGAFDDLNNLVNLLAYNPPGAGSEGYLFWLAWLNHNFNSIFLTQDAEGPLRRGLNIISCNTAKQAAFAAPANPLLRTEFEATGLPNQSEICENPVPIPEGP